MFRRHENFSISILRFRDFPGDFDHDEFEEKIFRACLNLKFENSNFHPLTMQVMNNEMSYKN